MFVFVLFFLTFHCIRTEEMEDSFAWIKKNGLKLQKVDEIIFQWCYVALRHVTKMFSMKKNTGNRQPPPYPQKMGNMDENRDMG
jgi:hypothetical protein